LLRKPSSPALLPEREGRKSQREKGEGRKSQREKGEGRKHLSEAIEIVQTALVYF
jgi:hypothetical protein